MPSEPRLRICVVGPGSHFLSGISYYTERLVTALVARHEVSVVLLRRLMPARWYPGRARVGAPLATLRYPTEADVYDGVDWFWGGSLRPAVRLLRRTPPDVVVLQWWTGTVLHSLIALAWLARRRGARVVLEFHEVQDTGEAGMALARRYVDLLFPLLRRLVDGAVAHSEYDRPAIESRYGLGGRPIAVIPHGPHHTGGQREPRDPGEPCTLLYFGVIRPYKGLEDLVRAFGLLAPDDAARLRLLVVGETWEGHRLPLDLIAASPYRDRIEVVNRYVTDDEVAGFLAAADAMVLPYRRSSASGPLHLAMSAGLPVVVTSVGGLVEAVREYGGAVLVPPGDVDELARGLRDVTELRGRHFSDPHSWDRTLDGLGELFAAVVPGPRRQGRSHAVLTTSAAAFPRTE